jgi:hypothetical protein
MVSSFQRRRIRVTFQLAAGTFLREGDPDTVVIEDFRASVDIDAPGGYEFSVCRVRMYGIEQQTMDRLSVINYQNLDFLRNSIRVEATDDEGEFSTIFLGEIYLAQPDYAGAPNVAFVVEARAGLIGSLAPTGATSFPGAQKVSLMMGQLASELGLTLENNGVESTLTDQYLSGTASQKIQRIADAARIQFWYVPEQGVLAIAPQGVARQGDPISYNFTNGLVGWPNKTHVGVMFTALFNPAIFHGSRILLESDVSACNGEWYIVSMSHRLDGETPGGAWFTHFVATPQNTTILRR